MGSVAAPVTRPAAKGANKPANGHTPASGDIPTNAIYANNEPIPDPSGTGYLRYGASV